MVSRYAVSLDGRARLSLALYDDRNFRGAAHYFIWPDRRWSGQIPVFFRLLKPRIFRLIYRLAQELRAPKLSHRFS